MAKSSRYYAHALKEGTEKEARCDAPAPRTLIGPERDLSAITCPKCSALRAKPVLKALPITIRKLESEGWGSLYLVSVDGKAVAFAAKPKGWSAVWDVRVLRVEAGDDSPGVGAVVQTTASKEAAYILIHNLYREGRLTDLGSARRLADEEAAARLEKQDRRRQRDARVQAAFDEMQRGFKSLLDRKDLGNTERAAIETARLHFAVSPDLLGVK